MSCDEMLAGRIAKNLMVRVGPERHDALVKEPHARPMDFVATMPAKSKKPRK